ncbi:MAG: N4-gp56 family major capsid protein [Rhodocyclaceae bacterium]|nr:N4-gp56 family major capsid protein [Rhodocyclaceae bacterium]
MANTDFGTLSALQKKVWSLQVSKQGRDDNFWMSNGFMSSNTNDTTKPIQRVTELTQTERGTECVMPLVADLTGGGVVGDNQLEGNEAALLADTQTIRIDQLRNGVRSKGRMSEQQTVIRFRAQAKDALAFWLADSIDEMMFLTAAGRAYTLNTDGSTRSGSQLPQLSFAADVAAASSNRIMYAGSATSEATLTSSDTMTWDIVVQAKAFAKRKRIRPVRAGGRSFYFLVLSTEQCRDLEKSSDYKSLHAQAMPRGLDNPLFNNAKKVISDVVIYDHQKVYNTLGLASGSRWGATGTVHGAQAMLLGAQALGFAELNDGTPGMQESDNTDYGNRPAIGISRIMGMLKPQFKSRFDSNSREDYGIVSIKTAAAAS